MAAKYAWRPHPFSTKVVGVSHKNDDGSSRQKIIRKTCSAGQRLFLVREPDNPHGNGNTIAVVTGKGKQVGYLGTDTADDLAPFIDSGGRIDCEIKEVIGGGGGFLTEKKNYGVVVHLSPVKPPDLAEPYRERFAEIDKQIKVAKSLEKTDVDAAIAGYLECCNAITRVESQSDLAVECRAIRFPINRLSMLLEKQGRLQECLKTIAWYERRTDQYGLTATDAKAIATRKKRVADRLAK